MKIEAMSITAIIALVVASIPIANAANTITADPSNVPLNGSTDVTLCVDNDTTATQILIVDPDGNILETKVINVPIPGGSCYTWTVPDVFDTVTALDTPGPWSFGVNIEEGIPFYIDFQVSFFVLPEAAIGAIASIGAALAVFGAYIRMKKR